MIKVFTSNESPDNNKAGDGFTQMISKWIDSSATKIKVTNIHSNSNEYGWMIIVQYEAY